MNVYVLIAGILTFLTFIAHTFFGTFETLKTKIDFNNSTIEKNWYQTLNAWHLVTADLLLNSILLIAISTSDILEGKKTIALIIGLQFLFWGFAWLLTLFATNGRKFWKQQFHWLIFLIISGLCLLGLRSF